MIPPQGNWLRNYTPRTPLLGDANAVQLEAEPDRLEQRLHLRIDRPCLGHRGIEVALLQVLAKTAGRRKVVERKALSSHRVVLVCKRQDAREGVGAVIDLVDVRFL